MPLAANNIFKLKDLDPVCIVLSKYTASFFGPQNLKQGSSTLIARHRSVSTDRLAPLNTVLINGIGEIFHFIQPYIFVSQNMSNHIKEE
jgi:hypothetical protein